MNKKNTSIVFFLVFIAALKAPAQVTDTLTAKDTLHKSASPVSFKQPKLTSFIPAAAAVTYGFVALNSDWFRKLDTHIYENTNKRHPDFHTPIDDYLRYAPAAAVFGLELAGVKGKNNLGDKTALFLISSLVTNGSVAILKRSSNRMRPNRYNDYSFPSGHTATAFAAAEYLHQEYGEQSLWYSVAGYTVASATGVFRLYRNYHWFSDVVAGAGMGVLSTKFTYLVYPSLKRLVLGKKKTNLTLLPVYQDRAFGMAFSTKL